MKYRVLIATAIAGAITMSYAATQTSKPEVLTGAEAKLSYSLGIMTGRTFSSHGVNINPKIFALGFSNAVEGGHSILSNKEMQNIIENFQKQDQQQAKVKFESVAKKNLYNGAQFLAKTKTKKGVVTTKSGLEFKVIKSGIGRHPKPTDQVVVNYEGSFINGKVFDSSYRRGQPASFPVNGVIKGWQEALQLMSPGAVWEVYVPSNLAYGSQNYPPMIGPNRTLIFKVELIAIK